MTDGRRRWLDQRRRFIGASEVSALFGLNPFESAYSLWAKKTGRYSDEEEETEWQRWGHLIEPLVCDEYARVTGRKVIDHGRYAIRNSTTCAHLAATLDREVEAFDDRGPGVMDAKNVGLYKANEWEGAAPLLYQIQIQAQLEVTGYKWGSLAVLIGGNTFRWCDVERDEAFIGTLRKKVEAFWHLVETDTPPPVDGSDSTAEVLRRLFPKDSGTTVALPGEAMSWTDEYQACSDAIRGAMTKQQLVKNKLIQAIGDNSYGVCSDRTKWSYCADKNGKRTLRLMGRGQ